MRDDIHDVKSTLGVWKYKNPKILQENLYIKEELAV